MLNLSRLLGAALVVLMAFTGCSSAPKAERGVDLLLSSPGTEKHSYNAKTLIFRRNAPNFVTETEYKSVVETTSVTNVRSYRITNDFGSVGPGGKTVVVVAVSGNRAGFVVYDGVGAKLVEYSKGSVYGNAIVFKKIVANGHNIARWFFGDKRIISVIDAFDSGGALVYSEVSTYTAR